MTPQDYAKLQSDARSSLRSRSLPQGIGGLLIELVTTRKLTLGIPPNLAFTAWTKMTTQGRLLAALGTLFMIWIIVALFWLGWKAALLSLIVYIIYSVILRRASRTWFRWHLMMYTHEFHDLYCAGHVTLRVNETGEHILAPDDWIARIEAMHDRSSDI